MKAKIFSLLLIFLLFSCKKETYTLNTDWQKISERVQFRESGEFLELKSGKFSYKIPHSKLPMKKIVLLNASLVGYFTELGREDRIAGVSSPEYIYSDKVLNLIKEGKIADVGSEQKYNVEKIVALKPDAVMTNHIASFENTYDLLKKNGIEVLFLDEYLEQDPLEKSKYLLLFGKLFGMDKASVVRFNEIKSSYDSLKTLTSKINEKPLVLANEIYGGQWYMPGGKTQLARLLKDAGGEYILKDNTEDKAVPMSFEEVYVKAKNARFWVNAGNHSTKKSLLMMNPGYQKLEVFNRGKIYSISGREKGSANDYFESGMVRSDLVLKDYIRIFHPHLLPDYQLRYLKELK